ncbi:MAG: 3-deoxy-7-phosphoheptulonate synthase [Cyclobacteriaceae bacterium]
MIIHLKPETTSEELTSILTQNELIHFKENDQHVIVFSSKVKHVPAELEKYTQAFFVLESDIQLASRSYQKTKHSIDLKHCQIGGQSKSTLVMAGPCSVESWDQIETSAQLLKKLGLTTLRAGCFKPRTSPYTFQGLGEKGLQMLVKIRELYGLNIITEVKDSSHVDMVIDHADIVQIGTKAMYDQSILRACGRSNKPILLKRGFGTTLQEFVQAAEFILSQGNGQVMLCERGIRTFENKTRFTLDLTGVAYLKEYTNLPIVVDPSHAMGYRYGVPDLTRAALAMGIDGLLIETHPDPRTAMSDAAQQLDHEEFTQLFQSLKPIAMAIQKEII